MNIIISNGFDVKQYAETMGYRNYVVNQPLSSDNLIIDVNFTPSYESETVTVTEHIKIVRNVVIDHQHRYDYCLLMINLRPKMDYNKFHEMLMKFINSLPLVKSLSIFLSQNREYNTLLQNFLRFILYNTSLQSNIVLMAALNSDNATLAFNFLVNNNAIDKFYIIEYIFKTYSYAIKLEDIFDKLVKNGEVQDMVLNYYKDQPRIYDILISKVKCYHYSQLIAAYPTLFQYNKSNHFVILNNFKLFKEDLSQ